MSLLSFFNKKAVWAFAFEVIISIVKFVPEGMGYHAKIRFVEFYNFQEMCCFDWVDNVLEKWMKK